MAVNLLAIISGGLLTNDDVQYEVIMPIEVGVTNNFIEFEVDL